VLLALVLKYNISNLTIKMFCDLYVKNTLIIETESFFKAQYTVHCIKLALYNSITSFISPLGDQQE